MQVADVREPILWDGLTKGLVLLQKLLKKMVNNVILPEKSLARFFPGIIFYY